MLFIQDKEMNKSNELKIKQMKTKTLKELVEEVKEKKVRNIPTFNQEIDQFLNGGISLGEITQIVGFPGSGKSQLCMQIACNVQLPEEIGGLNSESIYYDSYSQFCISRVQRMAECICASYPEYKLNVKEILEKIHVYQPHDIVSLCSSLLSINNKLNKVKVIIIDSIPTFYKKAMCNDTIRLAALHRIIQILSIYSNKYYLSVVIVNHLTTKKINSNYTSIDYTQSAPFLTYFLRNGGVIFTSYIKNSIFLYQIESKYKAIIQTTTRLQNGNISFEITEDGFR
ncbi:DNA repair protein RAD51C, putative [Entamoeba histolytica HM-3:IMSS]|uniref:DNA repair protein RAD51 homolog 3 n=3 Tax=Entamoeba histolytica TaxID=5759 RepID=A0A175JSJ8_ENTHI|nr:DNA repair protein RAD51C,putative [Entamoeba histolytica KU27]EMS16830.1 DNA repair protein RAD51C, putative [Entamoeba histolytica HM-3:IMSS]GAT96739.1 DNA repair protein rad51c putative [Entamoeba histolytica]